VLTESSLSGQSAARRQSNTDGNGTSESQRAYAPEALSAQPSIADLLPRRLTSIALTVLLISLPAAGLTALDIYRPTLAEKTEAPLQFADAAAAGSLAAWYTCLLLALTATASLVVHSLRRFRADDYRGRYRIWLWAALTWMALSILATTRIHLAADVVLADWTGWQPLAGGGGWWLSAAVLVLGSFLVRLAIEIRGSRLSLAALLLSTSAAITAVAAHFGWLTFETSFPAVPSAGLAAVVLLLVTHLIYGRYVAMQAAGLIAARPSRRKARSEETRKQAQNGRQPKSTASRNYPASQPAPSESGIGCDTDQSKPAANSRRSRKRNAAVASDRPFDDPADQHDSRSVAAGRKAKGNSEDEAERDSQWVDGSEGYRDSLETELEDGHRKLSKAQRKRLRRQKMQQRDAA